MHDYPQSDPVATGAPGSAVRLEWEAWRSVVAILKESDEFDHEGKTIEICSKHSAGGDCELWGCRMFAAIRDHAEAFAEVKAIQAKRPLLELLRRAVVAVETVPGGSAKALVSDIREALIKGEL